MLLTPWLLGAGVSGWRWVHLPLILAALAAYLTSWATGRWATSHAAPRFRRPALAYAVAAVVPALLTLALAPGLLWFAPLILVATAVQLVAAWRREERSLVNGLVAVAQACLLTPVAAVAGGAPWQESLPAFGAALLYFLGTVLHVKTMIRERGERAWYVATVAYHGAALLAASLISPWLALPFTLYLARTAILPRRVVPVPVVGAIEVLNSVLLVITCLAAGVAG